MPVGFPNRGKWRIHRGKPHLELHHRGRPVLIDSGCVNYDREKEREGYLKSRAAHNTVVVEPVEKDEWPGTSTFYSIRKFSPDPDGGRVTATCRYRGKGAPYVWVRTVKLAGSVLEITDKLTARRTMRCALHFHTAPCRINRRRGRVEALGRGWNFSLQCEDSSERILRPSIRRYLAIDETNQRFQAPDISFRQSGRTASFKTTIQLNP